MSKETIAEEFDIDEEDITEIEEESDFENLQKPLKSKELTRIEEKISESQ